VVGAISADAVSYAVSVASLLAIRHRVRRDRAVPGDAVGLRDLSAQIAEGLAFVARHPVLRKVAACSGTANLFSAMSTAVEIIFLVRVLHVRLAYTGLIIAAAAIGGVCGGVLAGRISRRVGSARTIWFALLVFGLPQILAPLAEPGWRIVLFPMGYAASFFSAVVYNVAQVSYRQTVCPPRLMGRVNAANRWISWGTLPVGGVIGGALGAAIGIHPTLWVALTGCWAAGFWVYFSPLRQLRDLSTDG
jgi:MFS family permease